MLPKKHVCVKKLKNWKQLDIIGANLKTGYEKKIEHYIGSYVFQEHLLNLSNITFA